MMARPPRAAVTTPQATADAGFDPEKVRMLDLMREYEQVTRVMKALSAGGIITSMTVSTPPDVIPPLFGNVATADLPTPPAMMTAILSYLGDRQNLILNDLAQLGVTISGAH